MNIASGKRLPACPTLAETRRSMAVASLRSVVGRFGYRHLSPRWDPMSGEGARAAGGRFTPPGSFPTLYLAMSVSTLAAELRRRAARGPVDLAGLLPRSVVRYSIELPEVLDLCDDHVRRSLGVDLAMIDGPDIANCRRLGDVAHQLGVPAIMAPSVTGVDAVLAVFPELLGGIDLRPELYATWTSPGEVPLRDSDQGAA